MAINHKQEFVFTKRDPFFPYLRGMETATTVYTGGLRTKATHIRSGMEIITDAPTDNHGKGEAFSPTDLMATSLGLCMSTVMGIKAEEHDLDLNGMTQKVTKVMGSNPRRVTEVIIEFDMPDREYSDKEKAMLEQTAINCPVAKSLHPDLKQTITFNYKR